MAGEGKRLRPYTLDRPKCMVEVDGISLIDRQLAVLQTEGLEDIVMIGGYKAEMLRRYGVKLKINPRYYETNMVWTLFCAEDELEGEVIVSYGDIVYSREILQSLLQSKADIAVTIDKDWKSYWSARNEYPLNDAETLKLREDETIIEIGQKPRSLDEIEGQYMGLMKFTPHAMDNIIRWTRKLSSGPDKIDVTTAIQGLIDSGYPVYGVSTNGRWCEIDDEKDLIVAEDLFSKGLIKEYK